MSIDLAEAHGWAAAEVASGRPIDESMRRLIDKCSAAVAHPDWAELRQLPFEDLAPLLAWIERPFRREPPGGDLQGLWFGLFNPVYNRAPVADIYVCGSTRFLADPHDNDWAVGPDWWPEDRYAASEMLAAIYRVAYREGGLGNDAEYPLCLAYGALAVRDLLHGIGASVVYEAVGSVGVAVGFDSGDFLLLGRVTGEGLVPL